MTRNLRCLAVLTLGLSVLSARAPQPGKDPSREAAPAQPPAAPQPPARAELTAGEAATPEALTASLYAFISGPAGQKRDAARIRALFHPTARILVAGRHPEKGPFLRAIELEPFLAFVLPQWEQGFFEQATATTVQRWEGVAQVWSPYAIRRSAEGPVAYTGVNALQCAWDGKRWWITHLAFESAPAAAPGGALR